MDLLRIIIKEIAVIKRILRRRYYILFRQSYVKEQLRKRKGICGYHGCCSLSILNKLYNVYYRRCLIKEDYARCLYWRKLPRECKVYPLDEKDKIPETKNYCNFYWEIEKPHLNKKI